MLQQWNLCLEQDKDLSFVSALALAGIKSVLQKVEFNLGNLEHKLAPLLFFSSGWISRECPVVWICNREPEIVASRNNEEQPDSSLSRSSPPHPEEWDSFLTAPQFCVFHQAWGFFFVVFILFCFDFVLFFVWRKTEGAVISLDSTLRELLKTNLTTDISGACN